jgi:uncharacterized protein (DUF3084 family)
VNVEGLGFALLVGILGGGIALLADRLGRFLGKKRLSLLNMRPRRTAETLTFCAGFFIPIVTLAIVLGVSRPVREWLLHAPDIIRQRDELNAEVIKDKEQLRTENSTLLQTKTQLDATEHSVRILKNNARNLKSVVDERNKQIQDAQAKYLAVDARYTETKARVDKLQKDYGKVQRDFASVQQTLANSKVTLTKLQADYRNLSEERTKADKALVDSQKQVYEKQKQVADLNVELTSLHAQVQKVQDSLTVAQDDLRLAKDQYQKALAVLDKTSTTVDQFTNENTAFLREPVIFTVGEELARVSVPVGLNEQETLKYVESLIDKASEVAAQRGAQRIKEADDRAAGLAPPGLSDQPNQFQGETVRDQLANFADDLLGAKKPSLIIALAQYNTVRGFFVFLKLERRDNPLVYKKNQPIAETTVEGSGDVTAIYEQIEAFIHDKVAERAKESNMVPVVGSSEPLGQVTPGELLQLVEKIHQWGRNTRLVALAGKDTYAGDTLALDFRLRQ